MRGGIEETSASFEARSAPRSYPTDSAVQINKERDHHGLRLAGPINMEKVGELSVAQHTIKTTILIKAQPARVWQVLTDFRAFPTWNPFIGAISGPLQEGVRLSIEITPPGRAAMRFRPTVLVVKPDQELRWRGALLIP